MNSSLKGRSIALLFLNSSQGSLVVVLDNLLKGAVSQVMQNLNLALGLDEYSGIIS